MAIVTFCTNGHRVRVKDHVVGKTVPCPTCGVSFQVAGDVELPLASFLTLDAALVEALPRACAFGTCAEETPARQTPASPSPPAAQGWENITTGTDSPAAPAPPLHPVIAERADLAWRIAFPGGDPTEPIDAATMQAWLDGGHATGTEVVWRADWPQWRPVQEVFVGLWG